MIHFVESSCILTVAGLRLHLLTPQQYPYLVQTLFGLLMLLPQTKAYDSLQKRLSSVPIITSVPIKMPLDADMKKK